VQLCAVLRNTIRSCKDIAGSIYNTIGIYFVQLKFYRSHSLLLLLLSMIIIKRKHRYLFSVLLFGPGMCKGFPIKYTRRPFRYLSKYASHDSVLMSKSNNILSLGDNLFIKLTTLWLWYLTCIC